MVGKESGKAFGIVGLLPVVDLGKQAAAKFIDDVAQAKAQVQGQQRCCRHGKQPDDHQISPQQIGKIGPLHLDGHPMAIGELGLVNLAQAGCSHRMAREMLKQLVCGASQFLLDRGQGDGVGEGGQVVLQLGELVQPVAPHQIGAGGEGLPHLDEAGPQAREGGQDLLGEPLLDLWFGA